MPGLEYASIPHCATEIPEDNVRTKPKPLVTSVSKPPSEPIASPAQPTSPTKLPLNLPSLLLSSSLNLPTPPPTSLRDGAALLSTREPLSLQITTVNFRRFVSKSGPIFWLQDRIEEVVMWRKGWKVTCTWMSIYAFLCYFPRMFLLLPHIILISVLLSTNVARHPGAAEERLGQEKTPSATTQQPKEGSADWYSNLQAIQNLMGAVSDLYDTAMALLPILTWTTPYTSQLLTVSCLSLILLIPVVAVIPLRPTLLFSGLLPLVITHPLSLRILPTIIRPLTRTLQSRVQRLVDNDNLSERHWYAKMRDAELWENERWTASAGWSKSNLKLGERKPWTRGRDGWSDVVTGRDGDVSSNLTFALSPGFEFVETEDWSVDREGLWEQAGVDDYGWMYTNDSWLEPQSAPMEEWKAPGMTRRRRWTRRIYLTANL